MPISEERLLQIAESKGIDTSKYRRTQPQVQPQAQGQQGQDINSLISTILSPRTPSENLFRGVSRFGQRLAGETPSDTQDDFTKILTQEAIKKRFEPQEGFATQEELPQESGGLPLKTVKYSKGRYIPEYGHSRPLVQFGGFDPNQFNLDGPENVDSEIPTIDSSQIEQDEMSDEELESFRQEALAQGISPEEIAQIDTQRQQSRGSSKVDITPAGSITPTQEGIQDALNQGFTQEEIDNFLQANRRQRGNQR